MVIHSAVIVIHQVVHCYIMGYQIIQGIIVGNVTNPLYIAYKDTLGRGGCRECIVDIASVMDLISLKALWCIWPWAKGR